MNTRSASRPTTSRPARRRGSRLTAVATSVAAAGALAVVAAPAQADSGHSIALTGPSTGTLGQPVVVTASGFVATDPYGAFTRYINAYVIPSNVLSTCPATVAAALSASAQTAVLGGDTIAAANTLPMGAFSAPLVWMPGEAGSFLVCAYMHRYESTPDAIAQHRVAVSSAPPPPPVPPVPPLDGTTDGGASAPAVSARPGLAQRDRRLVCSRGSWSGAPTAFSYAWKVGARIKPGATSRKLTITRALRGKKVRCGVTARNAAGSAAAWSRTLKVR